MMSRAIRERLVFFEGAPWLRAALCLAFVFFLFTAAAEAKPKADPKKKPQTKTEAPAAKKRPAAASAQASSVSSKAGGELERTLGEKKGPDRPPVFIRSTSVSLDSKSRVFTYRENVEIVRGDMKITADIVSGKYNENNEIEVVTCEQNVVITRGDRLKASSNRAVYDVTAGKIVLTEGPELNDRGNVLSADKVTIYVNEDRSEAEGNVRVKVIKSEGSEIAGAPDTRPRREAR